MEGDLMYMTQSAPELYGVRVVKYIRCSHDDQVLHGDTLEAQNEILDDFIARNHCVLIDTFIDEALTARKKYTNRKEFVRLLDGVRRHDFDVILFTKLDRWFRNIGDYHKIQEVLEANGVQWKAVTESYDTTTTNGRLHINIRLSVAQDECDRDSDRIKDVFAFKLKNKSFVTGSVPRGLMLDAEKHVVPDPEWKQFALDAFDMLEVTGSVRKSLFALQERYSCIYSYSSFIRMLKNPLYKGMYRDDPQFCDPLIDPDRFDHIQTLIKKNVRQRRSGTQFIFSGLLTCDVCGRSIAGYTTGRRRKDGSITRKPRYRCTAWNMNHSCTNNKSWMEEVLEDRVLALVRPSLSAYIADYDVEDGGCRGRNPAADAARIRTKLKKLYDLFMDDLIDRDLYKSEYDQLNAQLQEALTAADHPRKDVSELKKFLSQPWEDVYMDFSVQEKNAFWKSFVDTIRIREDGSIADIIFL